MFKSSYFSPLVRLDVSTDCTHAQNSIMVKKTLGMMCSTAELKSEVTNRDMELLLSSCQEHTSTRIAAAVAKESSWIKLWDAALDIEAQPAPLPYRTCIGS